MTFIWPQVLWLLVLVPILIAAYVIVLRRRKKAALRYASLSIVKEAMGAGQRIRRHVPPLLFLLALVALLVSIARPAAVVTLPSQQQTIILAIDVSGSMRATDVAPTRLEAAQAAAKAFVEKQPRTTRVGVVSFAGTAAVAQAPTENRRDIIAAIDRFQVQRATAIGSGLLVSLATLFPDADLSVSPMFGERTPVRRPLSPDRTEQKKKFEPVPPGSYSSAAIILLTDGQSTMGPDPVEVAKLAAERGVRVYTVGIGTREGEIIHFEGWTMRVRLDEDTLKQIADITRGEYFNAGTADELIRVYETLNTRLVLEQKETEITALFSAAAALLAVISGLLSLLWFNRLL
ncbi:MAG TPA: VWA domain-containing protein [Burkholderiales bacterium]